MKKIYIYSCLTLGAVSLCFVLLFGGKIINLNTPPLNQYPVRGVDVSRYQGAIDWELLASQGVDFAFIKATEGSSFVDENFTYNYEQASKTPLRVGAYHFFSYDSSGISQAEHFIKNVERDRISLPPVADVEFYGYKEKNPPERAIVSENLNAFLQRIEEHYGIKPIIYATGKAYKLYIAENFHEYDIWIRDVYFRPTLSDDRDWTFWQYSDRGKLKGYTGEEKFIDLNVFYGSKEDFFQYPSAPIDNQ